MLKCQQSLIGKERVLVYTINSKLNLGRRFHDKYNFDFTITISIRSNFNP